MANCLITQLKSSVNAELKKLGELRFLVKANSHARAHIVGSISAVLEGGTSSEVYFSDSSYQTNAGQSRDSGGDMYIVNTTQTDAVLKIQNYYNIISIFDWGHVSNIKAYSDDYIDGEFFKYITNLRDVNYSIQSTDLVNFANKALSLKNLTCDKAKGDISNLKNLTLLETLALRDSNKIFGNIEELTNLTLMTAMRFAYNSNVSGIIEVFLQGLLNKGKTGNLIFTLHGTGIYFKKAKIGTSPSETSRTYKAIFSSGTIRVEKNSDSSILYMTYDGTNWKDENGAVYDPTDV